MRDHNLTRDLETLFPYSPIAQLSDDALVRMLREALAAERKRGAIGRWDYCYQRHTNIIYCIRQLVPEKTQLL